jgi:cobalt/nickel transport system permease protein
MSARHGPTEGLYVVGVSVVHRMAPPYKLAATLGFVLAVVATPREAVWAFALDAMLVGVVAALAGLRLRLLIRRLTIEVPFLIFALFLPLVGGGHRTEVLGVSLSVDGLWGAWNILVKGTLGVAATVLLAATTTVPDLLRGLEQLRTPRAFTMIAGMMVRYTGILADDLHRMRIARQCRGYDPGWLWQARALTATAGTLFVRAYERGERVHLAMLARGFDGRLLPARPTPVPSPRPVWAAIAPTIAGLAALTAWIAL